MDTLVMVVSDRKVTLEDAAQCIAERGFRAVVEGPVLTISSDVRRGFLILVTPEDYEANGIVVEEWQPDVSPSGTHTVFSFDYRDSDLAAGVVRGFDSWWPVLVENAEGEVRPGASVTPEFLMSASS